MENKTSTKMTEEGASLILVLQKCAGDVDNQDIIKLTIAQRTLHGRVSFQFEQLKPINKLLCKLKKRERPYRCYHDRHRSRLYWCKFKLGLTSPVWKIKS